MRSISASIQKTTAQFFMTTTEKKTQPKRSFFQTAKLVFWSFISGLVVGGGAGGYVGLNADKLNLPFVIKGSNNSQTTDINKNSQAGSNTTGNTGASPSPQASVNPTGNAGTNPSPQATANNPGNTNNSSGESSTTGANPKIDIKITPKDANFQNDKLPGFFPEQGFSSKPPQLNTFEGASVLTRDAVLNGESSFSTQKQDVAIRGRAYTSVFSVQGSNEAKRLTFKLDPAQKGVLLQFGMADLEKGKTDLTYQVNVLADGNRVWSGKVVYGANQQILSVPLDIPNATALTIEYATSNARAGDSQTRNLIFTRAEQLFK
jgi:hypothetical protein